MNFKIKTINKMVPTKENTQLPSRIRLEHHKNKVIMYQNRFHRCICCDHEFAVYAEVKRKDGYWVTKLDKLFSVANSPNDNFNYEVYHDDYFAMIIEANNFMNMNTAKKNEPAINPQP